MRSPSKRLLHAVFICSLCLLAYSNTFNVPFQWDDKEFIARNPIIKDFGYFLSPWGGETEGEGAGFYEAARNRYVSYLTFALNYRFGGLSLVFALLAMKTKENAFTLPLAAALYEGMFFEGALKKRLSYLLPFLLMMPLIPFSVIDVGKPVGEAFGGALRTQLAISRHDYFITQLPVLLTYLRLLVLPINQNLDYDYPIYRSFLEPEVIASFALLLGLFSLSIYLYFRSKSGGRLLRVVSFGIMWFFLTLSVESGAVALGDLRRPCASSPILPTRDITLPFFI